MAAQQQQNALQQALSNAKTPAERLAASRALANQRVLAAGNNGNPMPQQININHDPMVTSDQSRRIAQFWLDQGRTVRRDNPKVAQRYERARQIIEGTYPADELWKALNLAPMDSHGAGYEIYDIPLIAESFRLLHRDDLAREVIERWSKLTNDPSGLALPGDWALAANKPAEAIGYYRRAAMVDLTDASLMYRLGFAYGQIPAQRAIGEQLMAFAPLLVLGDRDDANGVLHRSMLQFGGKETADRWVR